MPSLKHLRNRIASVKSTKKITSAMKMVAASKLRQSQDQENNGKHYSFAMEDLLKRALSNVDQDVYKDYPLLAGTGKDEKHLLIIVTSDRGLCGGFNSNLVRSVKLHIHELIQDDKTPQLICIGRKGHDALRREFPDMILNAYTDIDKPRLSFDTAQNVAEEIMSLYDEGAFDVCSVFYNRFKNAISQIPTREQVIPCPVKEESMSQQEEAAHQNERDMTVEETHGASVFDPKADQMLKELLPRSIATHIYKVLLNSAAGEHAARMNAMDSATNNAGEMIDQLTLDYNRARQANITGELIEIISAMEAM